MSQLNYHKTFDVIVVGAGHAGCEAALAAAKMGHATLLLTMNLETIAQMSCNPAIGGPGKGHLAREIDALGGAMGTVIDKSGIQFRMLNTKKGPAVWAPRAQADKSLYHILMKNMLEIQPQLDLKQLEVVSLIIRRGAVIGVETQTKLRIFAKKIIITSGTFLNGVIHIGNVSFGGGRMGEFSAAPLAEQIRRMGFRMGRLKTGTPARLNSQHIDFKRFMTQEGDVDPRPFSYDTQEINIQQVPCHLGWTNHETHKIVRQNLKRSPLFSGKIKGAGVRYCPSIEDKVVKFPEKDRHQIFLEPEGRHTNEVYINGLSTSLPQDAQIKMIRSIPGLERAQIMRFGYAIEYDFSDPTQLLPTLETKRIKNLYFAGQINGTTGYEEAACQGLIAGINACLSIRKMAPFILERTRGYAGVLIDDLVTKGTAEPYRLFTARVEHRLVLRQDNADLRLGEAAFKFGLIPREKIAKIRAKQKAVAAAIKTLREIRSGNTPLAKILCRPEMSYARLCRLDSRVKQLPREIAEQAEIEIKYEGYIRREQSLIERLRKLEARKIPPEFSCRDIGGLKKEAREKLELIRPQTLGQAARISGITSTDISLVLLRLEAMTREKSGAAGNKPAGVPEPANKAERKKSGGGDGE